MNWLFNLLASCIWRFSSSRPSSLCREASACLAGVTSVMMPSRRAGCPLSLKIPPRMLTQWVLASGHTTRQTACQSLSCRVDWANPWATSSRSSGCTCFKKMSTLHSSCRSPCPKHMSCRSEWIIAPVLRSISHSPILAESIANLSRASRWLAHCSSPRSLTAVSATVSARSTAITRFSLASSMRAPWVSLNSLRTWAMSCRRWRSSARMWSVCRCSCATRLSAPATSESVRGVFILSEHNLYAAVHLPSCRGAIAGGGLLLPMRPRGQQVG